MTHVRQSCTQRFDEDPDFTYCISTSNVPENAIYQKFRKTAHTTPVAEVVLRFATVRQPLTLSDSASLHFD